MEHEKKTKRRTYLWILLAALAFFPLLWMLQPSMASPYSTALQMNEGNLAVESIHPVAPNRLERFGTDPLGRHVATLLSNSLPQAMGIAVLAAFLRAVLGAVCTRLHFWPRMPVWFWAVMEVILYRFVFLLPYFRTGTAADHRLLLVILLGLYFFPAQHEDLRIRKIGLLMMEQFMRILVLFVVLGLLGLTLGANPYGAIPTSFGPVNFTYPSLINLTASIRQTGLSAWWTWGIPVIAVSLLVIAVLLAKTSMQDSYERMGVYFTGLGQDFLQFLNPVQAVRELFRFTEHLGKNSLRIFLLLLVLLVYTWGRNTAQEAPYTPFYKEYAAVRQEVADLQTPEERLDYAALLMQNSKLNPNGDTFRIDTEHGSIVSGTRPGVSRVQPLVLVFDVREDHTTFALQTALFQTVLDNASQIWLQQSIVFAFTDYTDADFRSSLDISGHGFYAILSGLSAGEPVQLDETLVYPGNSWAAAMARDFRHAFDTHAISHTLSWLHPQDPIALRLNEQGLIGIQLRGGSDDRPQETLQALTDAIMRYGTRRRSR